MQERIIMVVGTTTTATIIKTTGWDGHGKLIIYTESGLETSLEFTVTIAEE